METTNCGKKGLLLLVLAILLGLTMSLGSASAAEPPKDPKVFKIGIIDPLTGPVSYLHQEFLRASQIALKEINGSGGIAGIPLDVVFEDNKGGDAKTALSSMNKLIFIDKIQACLVSFASAILAAQPLAAENKILQINTAAWSPELVNRPYLFNNKITGDGLIDAQAKAAWADGNKKLAILYPNHSFGLFALDYAKNLWTKWGGELVAHEAALLGQTDFHVQLTKIKSANPDVIFTYYYGVECGYVAKQAKELGLDVHIYGTMWFDPSYKVSGPAGAGFRYVEDYWNPVVPGSWAKRLVDTYEQLYGTRKIEVPTVNTYEAIYVIRDLIEEARKMGGDYYRGEILKDILLKKRSFKSVYGSDLIFRENGTCIKTMGLYEVNADGSTKLLQLITPKE